MNPEHKQQGSVYEDHLKLEFSAATTTAPRCRSTAGSSCNCLAVASSYASRSPIPSTRRRVNAAADSGSNCPRISMPS